MEDLGLLVILRVSDQSFQFDLSRPVAEETFRRVLDDMHRQNCLAADFEIEAKLRHETVRLVEESAGLSDDEIDRLPDDAIALIWLNCRQMDWEADALTVDLKRVTGNDQIAYRLSATMVRNHHVLD